MFFQTLSRHALTFRYVDPQQYDVPSDLNPVRGLVLLGGPMSVNDSLAWLRPELYLIERALQRNLPILGICLGAQLLAKALGARVYRNPSAEIGFFPISPTPAASSDPLLRHLHPFDPVFHWHAETFDLPRNATHLAYSETCPNQAFRYGSHAWGFQFHPEASPSVIREWIAQDRACGDARELNHSIDANLHAGRREELAEAMFSEWLNLL